MRLQSWRQAHGIDHWRQRRRGCRGTSPPIFWLRGTSTGISPPILLRTFGYSRPLLVALRSLSLKPISFGYKTPPIRFSQEGGQSAHEARPPTLNSRWRHWYDTIRYDTIRDAILTCARKPTWVSLIHRTGRWKRRVERKCDCQLAKCQRGTIK